MGKGPNKNRKVKRAETEAPSSSEDEESRVDEEIESRGRNSYGNNDGSINGRKKSGGGSFTTMGFSVSLLKAIQRKGYRLPTPIQRKCIPPLMEGRDVVGMARTGSGKTAAFLLPLLHSLKNHSLKVGIRGLILSPSRELALQTFSVLKELSKFTDLRSIVLVGGEGVEEQFSHLATNPDIVVATPGRLMHLCVEAKLSLQEVSFVVWDEADRLMEDPTMAQQIVEINARFPEARQTALFSATLPKALAEFAQAGLRNPLLVRLDVESKLSPDLKMTFLSVHNDSKDALLLLLLTRILSIKDKPQSTVIFVATKHHVEYLQELLTDAYNLPCTYIYGSLDQTARKIALDQFRIGKKRILVVTDVAARGIDIPLLDNVINYDFPPTPKLFVHRVGRVARAGRSGTAYSLITPDEMPYLFDLQLFLGGTLLPSSHSHLQSSEKDLIIGAVPQKLLDEENEGLLAKLDISGSISALKGVMKNACKLYRKTRPAPSPESHRRWKEFNESYSAAFGVHSMFSAIIGDVGLKQESMIQAIQNYKPKGTHLSSITAAPSLSSRKKHAATAGTSETPDTSKSHRDEYHYLKYRKEVVNGDESAYSLGSGGKRSFAEQARSAILDIQGSKTMTDEPSGRKSRKHNDERNKLVKTDMGTKVPASFRSDLFDKWRSKTHLDIQRPGEIESESASGRARAMVSASQDKRKWRGPMLRGKSGAGSKNNRPGNGKPKFGGNNKSKPGNGKSKPFNNKKGKNRK